MTEPNENSARQHERIEARDGIYYSDTLEGVDIGMVTWAARVNGALLANLALAPAPPGDVRFVARGPGYDTYLSWKRGTEPDLAGYRVLWRATYAPFWEHVREVGDSTEAALPGLSQDDLFFAVQAIDRDGHASLPALPSAGASRAAR